MRARNRFTAATVAVAMTMSIPLAAVADEDSPSRVREQATEQTRERVAEPTQDQAPVQTREEATEQIRVRVAESVQDHVTDRPADPPVHECVRIVDNPGQCFDDLHPHDFNVRQLFWRLVQAREWKLLHRLLHWLVT